MTHPILVTGAAGRVGGVGGLVVEALQRRSLPVRAMVRREDERAAARDGGRSSISAVTAIAVRPCGRPCRRRLDRGRNVEQARGNESSHAREESCPGRWRNQANSSSKAVARSVPSQKD